MKKYYLSKFYLSDLLFFFFSVFSSSSFSLLFLLLQTDGFSDLELVSKDFSMWVPQVAPISGLLYYPAGGALDPKNGVGSKDFKERRWINEDGFTVPEVRPPPYKRSRPFWEI